MADRLSGGANPAVAAKPRRRLFVAGIAFGAAALAAPLVAPPAPRLVWNATRSAPTGLYFVAAGRAPRRGDMVVAHLPSGAARLAASRGYLPLHVPVVKRAAAAQGDRVCALGSTVFINGEPAAKRLPRDPQGRPLPAWRGCARLSPRQVFLLMRGVPDSFDGRYFGVSDRRDVIGVAELIWPA
jgi:conjugative transfer signal peptidase TraF